MVCKESYYLKLKDEKDVNILFSIFHSWHLNGNKGQKWTMVSLKNRNSIQCKEKEKDLRNFRNSITFLPVNFSCPPIIFMQSMNETNE